MSDILLIEDDREIATTLQQVLGAAGYSIRHAFNGIEGRKLLDEAMPRLVITDMMMPKMGGFPVLEYLRTLPTQPKVVMITANEGGRHKAYAEHLGVSEYLRKPFPMETLLETVAATIGEPGEDAAETQQSGTAAGGDTTEGGPLRSRLGRNRAT